MTFVSLPFYERDKKMMIYNFNNTATTVASQAGMKRLRFLMTKMVKEQNELTPRLPTNMYLKPIFTLFEFTDAEEKLTGGHFARITCTDYTWCTSN